MTSTKMESLVSIRGPISLPIIIAIVLGLGFGASAYLNYVQYERDQQDETLLQGQITDLKYQLNLNNSASPSPSPLASTSPSPTDSPTPSSSPAVAGTSVVPISQFAVKFTVTDPITDLTYQPARNGSYDVAAFTTQSLIAKYPACKAGAIGSLVQKRSDSVTAEDTFVKSLGGMYYFYVAPTFTCTGTTDGRNQIAQDEVALKNSALPSLAKE
jgi:hypothetical protein